MNASQKHPNSSSPLRRLSGWRGWFCVLMVTFLSPAIRAVHIEEGTAAETAGHGFMHMLGISVDELIMLLVSLAVVIEIVGNFKFCRWIPSKRLILCAFFLFCLSAVLTIAESFIFNTVFNYGEHLSLMAAAILLAVWCLRVFALGQQEKPR